MAAVIKVKQLRSLLQDVGAFSSPKIELEQYATTPDLAARILLLAASNGDITGRSVVDLGCGTCMLSIAAVCCGAASVIGVDRDEDALGDARSNLSKLEMDEDVDLLLASVSSFANAAGRRAATAGDAAAPSASSASSASASASASPAPVTGTPPPGLPVDTVIMNPPFGTRTAGADVAFIEAAAKLRPRAIYSLHKTSTRDFLIAKAAAVGYKANAAASMSFELPRTYEFHKKASGTVEVDLLHMVPAE